MTAESGGEARRPRLVVGVGASAGGLDAFKRLLAALPSDTGMAFLFVQHLDPRHESLLGELLAPCTSMTVTDADQDVELRPDTVYIIRPDTALAVRGDRIELSAPTLHRGVRLPVDHLFRSLGREYRARAAAVVLSGAGSDGSDGLREVKAAGGLTIAQDPEACSQYGMPRSAIETGLVDLVLRIEDIPLALERFANLPEHARIAGHPPDAPVGGVARALDAQALDRLAEVLESHLDFDLRVYKPGTVERRVLRRMGLSGFDSIEPYFDHLRRDAAEQRTLVRDLLISVTEFFREPASFDALRERVIDPLVARAEVGVPLRVWVPGCATGEEAYSIGMALLDALGRHGKRLPVQVFATDLDQDAVAFGRTAIYPPTIAERLSARQLADYFKQLDGKGYQVRPPLRDIVSFAVHDLTKDPPFSRMHLISCRNVLIYLTPAAQRRVLQALHFGLEPDGHLMLSTSESTGSQRALFSTVSKSQSIYQKVGVSHPISMSQARHRRQRPPAPAARHDPDADASHRAQGAGHDVARKAVLAAIAPPTIIVAANGGILFMHGELGAFLQLPQGDAPQLEISALLRPSIATRARGALYTCRRTRQMTTVLSTLRGGGRQRVQITARPVPQLGDEAVMLTFEAVEAGGAESDPPRAAPRVAGQEVVIAELEKELEATREDLRNAVEELESSNEELRSSNEESMSMNEELQSANEELEATTEELRSLNEELTTVNAQLRDKVEQLERAHDDLNNLFASTRIATVFLDERLRIKRFTPAAGRLLGIDHADIDRRVGDIARDLLQNDLAEDGWAVLEDLTTRGRELEVDGRWIDRQVLPYRTESRRIEGVVVTFTDVTELRAAHGRLLVKKRRLELAWEAARGGIYEQGVPPDEASHYSEQWAQVLGYRRDELPPPAEIADWFSDRVHPEDRAAAEAAYDDFIEGRAERYDVELRVRHRGGHWIWVHSICKALEHDPRGRVAQELGMMIDVSEQKAVEAALRESQGRFREMSDSLPLIIWVHGPDGALEYVNQTYCDFFGVAREAMVGGRWQILTHPDGGEVYQQAFFDALREQRPFHGEVRVRSADGAWRWMESWGRPRRGPDGEPMGMIGTSADVTERRVMEDALRESGARFRLLADNMAQLAWMADGQGRGLWFNKRWCAYTGMEPSQVGDEAWAASLHPDAAARVVDRMRACFAAGESWSDTFRLRSAEGEYRWFLSRAVPIRGEDGAIDRWLGTHTDVTERREAERRLVEADRQKNEFLAMLGHELRNPLAAIGAATQLLGRSAQHDPRLQRTQAVLARQTSHMSKLLDSLLDISRIIRGKITLDRDSVDLGRIGEAVAADLAERSPERMADVSVEVEDRPIFVDGDGVRLTQIIDNLLSNALKYTSPGDPIAFRVRREDTAAVIEVEDEGVGIEAELIDSIFDSFRQSQQNLDRSAGGLGLGLALVKSLTELHDGTVTAHSDGPGRGARFVVRLPLGTRHTFDELPAHADTDPMTLLLVEDSVDNAELMRDVFEMVGHTVVLAHDGSAGVRAALEHPIDAVICDIGLPGGMNGYDVARALRSEGKTRDLPLVALSGYGSPEDVASSITAGFDCHLTKPVEIEVLERRVREARAERARQPRAGGSG